MLVNIDFFSILTIVGKDLQDDWTPSAVFRQKRMLSFSIPRKARECDETYRNSLANQTVDPSPYPNLPRTWYLFSIVSPIRTG